MKKNYPIVIVVIVLVVALLVATIIGTISLNKNLKAVLEPVKSADHYNTEALELWGGGFSAGNITMVSAEVYGYGADGATIFLDQNGTLWTVADTCGENECYLLWIADNFTDTPNDDTVLKIWTEFHN